MNRILDYLTEVVDERMLLLIIILLVAFIVICCIVLMVTMDRDNEEMRMIIEGILKEKDAIEEEKKRLK